MEEKMYSVAQIVEMLKDHWDKTRNVSGDYLSYSEKTITEILKKDILGTKFNLEEGERRKVSYENFNGDMVTETLYVFPKYLEGGKIVTSSVWDELDKVKREKIIYVGLDTVHVENKQTDRLREERRTGRTPYLVSYGYFFSLKHELERRALPANYVLFSVMTKKMIKEKIITEVKVNDMQEVLNTVEEILSEFDKSINKSLLKISEAYQVEYQRLLDIRTFVVMRQKMGLLSTLDISVLDEITRKMCVPLEYHNGSIKKMKKFSKDFNGGVYQMNLAGNINYIAEQLYEYEKYEKKRYENFLLKVRQKEFNSEQFRNQFGILIYEVAMSEPNKKDRIYLLNGMKVVGIKYSEK
ncbi:hypothetical protein [Enterococcus casseliflavus]|uniref:hypothetical protein n=1 Tax=Enterococcus casseliflavus TaxID=37734 RepID=UPI003D13BCC6